MKTVEIVCLSMLAGTVIHSIIDFVRYLRGAKIDYSMDSGSLDCWKSAFWWFVYPVLIIWYFAKPFRVLCLRVGLWISDTHKKNRKTGK